MVLPLIILSFSLLNHGFAATIVPIVNKDLHIVNKDIAPDGFQRPTVLAGLTAASASFPGPLISGSKNQALKFNIDVHDELTDQRMLTGTSIHWHGLLQHHTNWADGPSFVNQCPITSGHNFNYDFPVPDQAGTYWYHSHYKVQYCDGLRGPLVIYDQNDPLKHLYDIDDETTIITLADWYHQFAQDIAAQGPTPSDSTLINGKGRWPGNPTAELAVINVQHGKRYRFRLISMSCEPNYVFSIDSHRLTIIETDGVATQPLTVDSIQIYAAQRYSFILEANQTVDNYWIRAKPNFANSTTFDSGINSAILRYQGAKNAEPPTRQIAPGVAITDDTKLVPLTNPAAPGKPVPGGADKVLNLQLGFNFNNGNFTINGTSFQSPPVPVLLQILNGNYAANELLPNGSVYGLPSNKVIELNLLGGNAPGGPHPFHLHGHAFSVVKSAGAPYNFKNPVRRDTTIVAVNETTTIRFVTDNPGPWFLHCHIDFHLEAGLAVVFAEDIPDIAYANPVPQDWNQLCPLFNQSIAYSAGSATLPAASST